MKYGLHRFGTLALLCLPFCYGPLAYAQSPNETRAFVRTIADGTLRQQREASKGKHPLHAALIAEAKRVNESGTAEEKAQFAFVLALFDVDYTGSRDRLLQMSRSLRATEALPTYLVRLYDQKRDVSFLESLLAMRGDGAVTENLADAEMQRFSQRPVLALRLISSDTRRFNQATETIAAGVWMERDGLTQAAFEKRKPFPQLRKASRSASLTIRQVYTRFVAAAYAKYIPMGKPTAKGRTKTTK